MANPNPPNTDNPFKLVALKFPKVFNLSGSIPVPVSCTTISKYSSLIFNCTKIVPMEFVNLKALFSKLKIICLVRSSSFLQIKLSASGIWRKKLMIFFNANGLKIISHSISSFCTSNALQ